MVDRAIDDAAFILERIDERWPYVVNTFAAKGEGQTLSPVADKA